MAQLLTCDSCGGKVSSDAAKRVGRQTVCPRCAPKLEAGLRQAKTRAKEQKRVERETAKRERQEQRQKDAEANREAAALALARAEEDAESDDVEDGPWRQEEVTERQLEYIVDLYDDLDEDRDYSEFEDLTRGAASDLIDKLRVRRRAQRKMSNQRPAVTFGGMVWAAIALGLLLLIFGCGGGCLLLGGASLASTSGQLPPPAGR